MALLTIKDIQVGDIVELNCPKLIHNTRHDSGVIRGTVEGVFDALMADGAEGNLQVDIRYGNKWLQWRPIADGGSITIIQRKR